eukprot:TRINITY_DN469_c0_g1_i10.p2 TRINITY_DN469_c0_g1~~TRINITY_DN469_c0_g1_i10.p2  ORF type:complete len:427 (-),score=118.77 TRINITY_DN469_c0_g1_i10:78-1358(-)
MLSLLTVLSLMISVFYSTFCLFYSLFFYSLLFSSFLFLFFLMATFTGEVVQEHILACDTGIKEVQDAFAAYSTLFNDKNVSTAVKKITDQLQIIKGTIQNPDTSALILSIASISDSIERFCASVYYALSAIGDSNEVLKEQIMETMQCCIQATIQLHIVATCKAMFITTINPEMTLLTALKTVLLSVSIIIEAVNYMKQTELIEFDSVSEDGVDCLKSEDIRSAIVYILHYGRPLFKGEGEEPEVPEPEEEPEQISPADSTPASPQAEKKLQPNDDFPDMDDFLSSEEAAPRATPQFVEESSDEKGKDTEEENSESWDSCESVTEEELPPPPPDVVEAVAGIDYSNPLTLPADIALSLNADSFNENNPPPAFEAPPPKPVAQPRSEMTEESYKAFMVKKYEYETWENKLILWKIKLKRRQDEVKVK